MKLSRGNHIISWNDAKLALIGHHEWWWTGHEESRTVDKTKSSKWNRCVLWRRGAMIERKSSSITRKRIQISKNWLQFPFWTDFLSQFSIIKLMISFDLLCKNIWSPPQPSRKGLSSCLAHKSRSVDYLWFSTIPSYKFEMKIPFNDIFHYSDYAVCKRAASILSSIKLLLMGIHRRGFMKYSYGWWARESQVAADMTFHLNSMRSKIASVSCHFSIICCYLRSRSCSLRIYHISAIFYPEDDSDKITLSTANEWLWKVFHEAKWIKWSHYCVILLSHSSSVVGK